MIKIETIYENTYGHITREGRAVPIYRSQIISYAEFETLVLTSGKVLVSIDEQELREVEAGTQQLSLNIDSTVQVPVAQETVLTEIKSETAVEQVQPTGEETQETKAVEAPVIVKPAPRKK